MRSAMQVVFIVLGGALLKENENKPVKKNINRMRQELHKLIENGNVDSEIVRNTSCELDLLIMNYYSNVGEKENKVGKEG